LCGFPHTHALSHTRAISVRRKCAQEQEAELSRRIEEAEQAVTSSQLKRHQQETRKTQLSGQLQLIGSELHSLRQREELSEGDTSAEPSVAAPLSSSISSVLNLESLPREAKIADRVRKALIDQANNLGCQLSDLKMSVGFDVFGVPGRVRRVEFGSSEKVLLDHVFLYTQTGVHLFCTLLRLKDAFRLLLKRDPAFLEKRQPSDRTMKHARYVYHLATSLSLSCARLQVLMFLALEPG
jgi:hypothetical protein